MNLQKLKNEEKMYEVEIEFLHEKGFGVGFLDGKKIGVYGVLPGEKILVKPTKKRHKVKIFEVVKFLKKSDFRTQPKDKSFISTSPLQIFSEEGEHNFKTKFIQEKLQKHTIKIGEKLLTDFDLYEPENKWNYRNKVEFCFFHDENDLLHLAFRQRGSHWGKIIETNSAILNEKINLCGQKCLEFLRKTQITGKNLKGLKLTYSSKNNKCLAVFYVKDKNLLDEKLKKELQKMFDDGDFIGILWAYSTHLSPQYRVDELEFLIGEENLQENILDKTFEFHHSHFFQGNIEGFNKIMTDLKTELQKIDGKNQLFDFYSGVGTIGIVVADLFKNVVAVEESQNSREYSLKNAKKNNVQNYQATETRFEEWSGDQNPVQNETVIIDPPRSGLSEKALEKLVKMEPKNLIYISCNPLTQARDLDILQKNYKLNFFKVYNLYPKTMHSESLAILVKK